MPATRSTLGALRRKRSTPWLAGAAGLALAGAARGTGSHGSTPAPGASGIPRIKHVVVIFQENRSFDSYFGTYPGADGIPKQGGVPSVCVPDPANGSCVEALRRPCRRQRRRAAPVDRQRRRHRSWPPPARRLTCLTEGEPDRARHTGRPRHPGGTGLLVRAWLGLLCLPVAFALAFAVAEGLYGATGYDPGMETPPHWADAVALIPAGMVFVSPCVYAAINDYRALKVGHPSGYVPAALAVLAALGYGALSVL